MIDYLHVASWASWLLHYMSLTQIPPPHRKFYFFDIVRIYVILCSIIVLGFFLLLFFSLLF